MRVVHCKREPYTVYIGRPSVLGNPFAIGTDGTREDVIAKFEAYARHSPNVLTAVDALEPDAVLGCWCHPKPCHGGVIMRLWRERREGGQE